MAYGPTPSGKPPTPKIQPTKIQTTSEHGLGQINPVKPPLPHTVEKATKQIAAAVKHLSIPAARAAAAPASPGGGGTHGAPPQQQPTGQAQGGNDFASFLAQFFQPTAPPDINAIIQSYLKPLQDMYSQQSGELTQQLQQQTGFDTSLAQQLGDYLKGIGGADYTPTMAAALGLEAMRNDNYAGFQSKQKLYDNIYGNSHADIAKLISDANSTYASSQPSLSDALSAFNAWNGYNETQYQHGRDTIKDQQTAAAGSFDTAAKRGALLKLYEGKRVYDPQTAAILGVKVGTLIPMGAKSAPKPTYRTVGGSLYQVVNGKTKLLTAAPPKNSVPKVTTRTVGGALYQWNGKQWKLAIKAPTTAASGRPVTQKVGGALYQWDGKAWKLKIAAPPKGAFGNGTAPDRITWPNLTKSQVMHLRSGIANSYYGFHGKDPDTGKPKDFAALNYQQAIDHAVQSGYSRAGAVKMANRFYMPGQRGRPKK